MAILSLAAGAQASLKHSTDAWLLDVRGATVSFSQTCNGFSGVRGVRQLEE